MVHVGYLLIGQLHTLHWTSSWDARNSLPRVNNSSRYPIRRPCLCTITGKPGSDMPNGQGGGNHVGKMRSHRKP